MSRSPAHPPTPPGVSVRVFVPSDEPDVIALWKQCGLTRPWNDPHLDIVRKREFQPDLFLVALLDNEIVGTVMAGYEGHRGVINYLAVAPVHQRRQIGRALMAEAEHRLKLLGCPKINLLVRSGNAEVIEFYRKIGFTHEEVVCLGKRLIDDMVAKKDRP